MLTHRNYSRRFDADNDGSIDAEELRQGLLKMNLADLPPSQVERVINEVDTDSDGVISLAELVMAITGEELSEESEESTMNKIEFSDNVMSRIIKSMKSLTVKTLSNSPKDLIPMRTIISQKRN